MTVTDPSPRRTVGLSTTAEGVKVPPVAERLGRRRIPDDVLVGWLVTLAVTALAGFLRFWRLGRPDEFAFDETYYAKDGWSLWRHGYAQNWVEKANQRIMAGEDPAGLQTGDPTMVVHPELAKWLIGAGEQLFGFDPFGWRFASAVVGTLTVLVMVRLARRLTGSTLLGGLAGLLLCLDGLHLVLSRLALVDVFAAFFLVCAVACLVADRDWTRARMAALAVPGRLGRWGPVAGLWWRPWRLTAGVMFGLAVSCKWSAVVPLAGFGLLVLVWDSGARRALGVRGALLRSAVVDGLPAFGYLVVVALVVYVASWAGWLVHADVYEEALARNSYGSYWGDYTLKDPDGFFPSLFQGLRSLAHYHANVFAFHSEGLVDASHANQSSPASWLVMHRPVVVSTALDIAPGRQGCTAPAGSSCVREVLLLGTPVLWWVGVVAFLHAGYAWAVRHDWRYGVALVGLATTWLPFFRYADRPIFSFYAVTMLPFTVIAVTLMLGRILGRGASGRRRLAGAVVGGAVVVLVVLSFAWIWPVLTYELLTLAEWHDRMWFRSWI